MIAVIFEVWPKAEHRELYFDLAAELKPRNTIEHRRTQAKGRARIFENYRLRVASVMRDYGLNERDQAPKDSRAVHEAKL